MKFWKWGFVGFLCAAFALAVGAVELGRNQPTERISGEVFFKVCFFFLSLQFQLVLSLLYPKFC